MADMEQLKRIIQYEDYKGINLNHFKAEQLKNLRKICQYYSIKIGNRDLDLEMASYPPLSLEEIRANAKEFFAKYFNIHDINFISMEDLQKAVNSIPLTATPEEVYATINGALTKISPFDIDINLWEGHPLSGYTTKPIILAPGKIDAPNRQMYFSGITLGNQLNTMTPGTLVHEIAHTQQEQNFGYAEDYLNREVISIFLEKIYAYEADPTGRLLKTVESVRFHDLYVRYCELTYDIASLPETKIIEDLMYVKSILNADKLFDMYLNERRQKLRNKYFYNIQDVFDGKITVEELLRKKGINTTVCDNTDLIHRHM